jgi:sporulation protein YlmC with PRC-barrel domain
MRTISVAAFSAAVLLAASAYAQSQTPSGDTTPRGSAPAYSPSATPKAMPQNPLKQEDISKIEGTTVLGSDSKKLGNVSRVLMKPEDKTIDRLVIHTGGILGMGGRLVALPIDDFSWVADAAAFKVSKTADDLQTMAEWHEPGTAASATGSSQPPQKSGPTTPSGN